MSINIIYGNRDNSAASEEFLLYSSRRVTASPTHALITHQDASGQARPTHFPACCLSALVNFIRLARVYAAVLRSNWLHPRPLTSHGHE